MKRVISFILVLCLLVPFGICGAFADDEATENQDSTEIDEAKAALLEQATSISVNQICDDYHENVVKAQLAHCGQVYLLIGKIRNITLDYVLLSADDLMESWTSIEVVLPLEDVAELEVNQVIAVVGTMGDEITENGHFTMDEAYLVSDTFLVTGKVHSLNNSLAPAYNFKIGDDPYLKLVYFKDGIDGSEYVGKTYTIQGYVFIDEHTYNIIIREAEIIEDSENTEAVELIVNDD